MGKKDHQILRRKTRSDMAYELSGTAGPVTVFCGGFLSDRAGTKAMLLDAHLKAQGRSILRFDYTGHGDSGGDYRECTISTWLQDTLDILDMLGGRPVILAGSSMGGWVANLAAIARPEQAQALILIAPAHDFTEKMILPGLSEDGRKKLEQDGGVEFQEGDYPPYTVTRDLIEDGRRHLLLDGDIGLDCPVRIFHGQADTSVPWDFSLRVMGALTGDDVTLTLVRDAKHGFSRPQDFIHVTRALDDLLARFDKRAQA